MSEYDALIFDNDGILVELTDRAVLRGAIRDTYAEFDIEPTDEDVERLIGTTVDTVEAIAEEYAIEPEQLWYRRDMNAAAAQRERLRAGDKPLYDDVGTLSELSTDLAIVSNNQHRTIEHVLAIHGLHGLFDTYYGRDPTLEGIERKKPSAYYLERVLTDLETDEALYVGDSSVDVLASEKAGIDCAFVRRPHRDGYDLPVQPTYEIETLADLPAILRGDDDPFRTATDIESPT